MRSRPSNSVFGSGRPYAPFYWLTVSGVDEEEKQIPRRISFFEPNSSDNVVLRPPNVTPQSFPARQYIIWQQSPRAGIALSGSRCRCILAVPCTSWCQPKRVSNRLIAKCFPLDTVTDRQIEKLLFRKHFTDMSSENRVP